MLAECNFIHENMKVTFASGLINMLAECNFIHENMTYLVGDVISSYWLCNVTVGLVRNPREKIGPSVAHATCHRVCSLARALYRESSPTRSLHLTGQLFALILLKLYPSGRACSVDPKECTHDLEGRRGSDRFV